MRYVRNVVCPDTQRDITPLLNDAADRHHLDAVGLLAGLIAESGLRERAIRKRTAPDWSVGVAQPTLRYWGHVVPGVRLKPDRTAIEDDENWRLFVDYFCDARRSIDFAAPLYAERLAQWGSPIEAWCRWNRPSSGLPAGHPNRLNYERSLAEAERYAGKEAPTTMPDIVDLRGKLPTLAGPRWPQTTYGTRDLAGITGVTLHYTAGSARATAQDIAAYQTSAAAIVQTGADQPFPGIAYTFLVDGTGAANLCHDLATRPWHSAAVVNGLGRNYTHVGLCYTGLTTPNAAQRAGLVRAIHWCERQLGRALTIEGHRDAPYATSCPGPDWPRWKAEIIAGVQALRQGAQEEDEPMAPEVREYLEGDAAYYAGVAAELDRLVAGRPDAPTATRIATLVREFTERAEEASRLAKG